MGKPHRREYRIGSISEFKGIRSSKTFESKHPKADNPGPNYFASLYRKSFQEEEPMEEWGSDVTGSGRNDERREQSPKAVFKFPGPYFPGEKEPAVSMTHSSVADRPPSGGGEKGVETRPMAK